jgi:hypothetical protein
MLNKTIRELLEQNEFFQQKEHFILDDEKNAIPATLLEWGEWMEEARSDKKRIVGKDTINQHLISTVFLGINHSFFPGAAPCIFETMVFQESGHGADIYCRRYSTWKQAEEGHARAVQWVLDGCSDADNIEDGEDQGEVHIKLDAETINQLAGKRIELVPAPGEGKTIDWKLKYTE